jgi:uncharacterized protein
MKPNFAADTPKNVSRSAVSENSVERVMSAASPRKRIWIDLDNSPHVPFFAPIIKELERRGYTVELTARDAYQVRELADFFQFNYKSIGRHYGKHKVLKVLGTCIRAMQLMPMAFRHRPALAVAHGSRSQVLACSVLRIPSLSIYDYEFTSPVAYFKPTWVMTPDLIPAPADGKKSRALQYPGIKEDVYVPSFSPDPSIQARLGISDSYTVALMRPPANEAHYHNPQSEELFKEAMQMLGDAPGVKVIVLPRNGRQAASVRQSWTEHWASGKFLIPERAEDGLNLIWYSDLVISGGGTMNREAAALGVPVYSIFRGHIGAVDQYLAKNGRLVLVEDTREVRAKIAMVRRIRPAAPESASGATLAKIVDNILSIIGTKL